MQLDPNRLLALTPEAKAWLCAQRPELTAAFTEHAIEPASILHPAEPRALPRLDASIHSVHPVHTVHGLGDAIAALLRLLGISAAIARLHRRGLLAGCQCERRRHWLNRHTLAIETALWLATLLLWLLATLRPPS